MTEQTKKGRELFIGLVSAVGTDLSRVTELLTETLAIYSYRAFAIRLAELLDELSLVNKDLKKSPADEYIKSHMDAGDDLRQKTGRADALTVLAFRKVQEIRETGSDLRRAFIFRSLKHPDEIASLRSVYGDSFYLIAAYSSQEKRKLLLAQIGVTAFMDLKVRLRSSSWSTPSVGGGQIDALVSALADSDLFAVKCRSGSCNTYCWT